MGRKKITQVREIASVRGWFVANSPILDEQVLASVQRRRETLPASYISTLKPWREQIAKWGYRWH